jgi:hypothetical protein
MDQQFTGGAVLEGLGVPRAELGLLPPTSMDGAGAELYTTDISVPFSPVPI